MSNESYINAIDGELDLNLPEWLSDNVIYETLTGSHSYGVDTPTSDRDIVGIAVPPKEYVFPHLQGNIPGFGPGPQNFRQWSQHHLELGNHDVDTDFTIISIVRVFDEWMDAQPNWLEVLFTPRRCVLTEDSVFERVLLNRELFLHQGAYHRFTGFAKSQLSKMRKHDDKPDERRLKYGYHAVRLLDECHQIMTEADLELNPSSRVERLREIREGSWSLEDVQSYCDHKFKVLGSVYESSEAEVPYEPDHDAIKRVLLQTLQGFYGGLRGCIQWEEFGE